MAAAGAVVTKSVPPWAIVGGNPARLIRMRFPDHVVERLQRLRWWSYCFAEFARMPFDDPEPFLDQLEHRAQAGDIAEFAPAALRLAELFEAAPAT